MKSYQDLIPANPARIEDRIITYSQLVNRLNTNVSVYGNSYLYQQTRIALNRSVNDNKQLLYTVKMLLKVAKAANWNFYHNKSNICPYLEKLLKELPPEIKDLLNEKT